MYVSPRKDCWKIRKLLLALSSVVEKDGDSFLLFFFFLHLEVSDYTYVLVSVHVCNNVFFLFWKLHSKDISIIVREYTVFFFGYARTNCLNESMCDDVTLYIGLEPYYKDMILRCVALGSMLNIFMWYRTPRSSPSLPPAPPPQITFTLALRLLVRYTCISERDPYLTFDLASPLQSVI